MWYFGKFSWIRGFITSAEIFFRSRSTLVIATRRGLYFSKFAFMSSRKRWQKYGEILTLIWKLNYPTLVSVMVTYADYFTVKNNVRRFINLLIFVLKPGLIFRTRIFCFDFVFALIKQTSNWAILSFIT